MQHASGLPGHAGLGQPHAAVGLEVVLRAGERSHLQRRI